jgi:hypothetical protein
VLATGHASGASIAGGGSTNYDAASHFVFQAYPTFEWQSISSVVTGSAAEEVGKLKITANGDEDISFVTGNDNEIVIQVTTNADSTATSALTGKWSGTTLDAGGTIDFDTSPSQIAFDFTDSALTIAAGASKTITFTANTSAGLEDDGDLIQLSLDEATASDLSFGIDGSGDYDEQASILFGGDFMPTAFSAAMTNPS